MSILLTFEDRDGKPERLPTSTQAQRAGTWAAERGHYRVAQQLMGLACALEEVEQIAAVAERGQLIDVTGIGDPRTTMVNQRTGELETCLEVPRRIVKVPMYGQTRTEHPRTAQGAEPGATAVLHIAEQARAAMDAVSHAPQQCAVCTTLMVHMGNDQWRHLDDDGAYRAAGNLSHEATPKLG
jgi:hypothetical protein